MSKILVITGGSRGIGASVATLAAREGIYDICIAYHTQRAAAEALLPTLTAKGKRAIAVQADVSKEEDIVRLFKEVDEKLGKVTHLVNSAGIVSTISRLDQMDSVRLKKVFETNIIGSFIACREAIKRMSTKYGGSGGVIVNLSSAAARLGSPTEFIDYAASKGAIDTMTIGLAKEVAMEGIRVNAIRPGLILTDIHASAGAPDRVERLVGAVPMQRAGTADEVAESILWLLSDKASYVTGSNLDVSGGR